LWAELENPGPLAHTGPSKKVRHIASRDTCPSLWTGGTQRGRLGKVHERWGNSKPKAGGGEKVKKATDTLKRGNQVLEGGGGRPN